MTVIVVNVIDLGAAADLGAVRYNLPTGPVLLVHETLTVDEQAELLAEFTRPGETAVFVNDPVIPAQRRPVTLGAGLRVAVAAASASAIAACGVPGVSG